MSQRKMSQDVRSPPLLRTVFSQATKFPATCPGFKSRLEPDVSTNTRVSPVAVLYRITRRRSSLKRRPNSTQSPETLGQYSHCLVLIGAPALVRAFEVRSRKKMSDVRANS